MFSDFIILLLILLIVASLVKGSFAFTVLYLVFGAYLFARMLTREAEKKIKYKRDFESRAFCGEEITIRLEVRNTSLWPVPWLYLYESLPVELASGSSIKRVVSLGPRGKTEIDYALHTHKRGYYPVGPLFTAFGDTIGLAETKEYKGSPDHITVYPRIIPFTSLMLPSYSPQGTLRHRQPVFEDPTRVLSKRDYIAGDSLRRVDWKATAAVGRLQVKQFEPSIALETVIFLNLNAAEYLSHYRIDSTELAIVIAASIANWVIAKKQAVGLVTNGIDHVSGEKHIKPLPSRKGRNHLTQILDVLARVQSTETRPLVEVLRDESPNLPWGTTLIVITGQVDEALFDELFQIKRRGQTVMLVIAGHTADTQKARQQAEHFGFPVYAFQTEKELDAWRR